MAVGDSNEQTQPHFDGDPEHAARKLAGQALSVKTTNKGSR